MVIITAISTVENKFDKYQVYSGFPETTIGLRAPLKNNKSPYCANYEEIFFLFLGYFNSEETARTTNFARVPSFSTENGCPLFGGS